MGLARRLLPLPPVHLVENRIDCTTWNDENSLVIHTEITEPTLFSEHRFCSILFLAFFARIINVSALLHSRSNPELPRTVCKTKYNIWIYQLSELTRSHWQQEKAVSIISDLIAADTHFEAFSS